MNIQLPAWVHQHLVLIGFVAWLLSNLTAALPSPTQTSSVAEKIFFSFMHATFGAVPRVIATIFPQFSKFFTFGNGNQQQSPPPAAQEKP